MQRSPGALRPSIFLKRPRAKPLASIPAAIHPSMDPWIDLSFNPPIDPSTDLLTHPSLCPSMDLGRTHAHPPYPYPPSLPASQPSLHQAMNPPVNKSREQSIEAACCFMAAAGCVHQSGPWNQSPTLKVYSSYYLISKCSNMFHIIAPYFRHLQRIHHVSICSCIFQHIPALPHIEQFSTNSNMFSKYCEYSERAGMCRNILEYTGI